jgi:hypothetical protein
MYVQLYAYNPGRSPEGAADLVAQAEVLKGGTVLAVGPPEPMKGDQPGSVSHLSRIRLSRFDPGEYELRVTVTDRMANAMVRRTASFRIE